MRRTSFATKMATRHGSGSSDNPRLPGDVVDGANDLSALSSFSIDSKLQRQNAIRQAARIAFLQVQTSEAVQRAVAHKSRVRKYNFEPGDLVYVFRERRPTVKGKRAQKQWLGPCTVVGTEDQNFWVSEGGRCLLCAPEHLRPAEASEISELLKIKAAMGDIQALIDEDKKLGVGFAPNESVDIPKGMGNEEAAPKEVFHDNRTAVGCLSWVAKETRPDLAFAANVAQSRQNAPSIRDIKVTNAAVKQAREYQDFGVMVARIPIKDMSIVVYHDAAWRNVDLEDEDLGDVTGHKVGSQLGYLIIGKRPGAASLLAWRSHTCRRVCRSTFAGETMACCEGMECAIQMRAQLLSLKLRRLVSEDEAARMIPVHAVTDCRSLFDFVHRCGAPKATADKRLVIDLASLRQIFLNEARGWWHRERGTDKPAVGDPLKIPLHWVPSECQLGDVLTKQLKPEAWCWWKVILAPFFLAVHVHNRL